MQNETVNSLALEGSVMHNMSIWGLFIEADVIVKLVIFGLLLASFWSWAIIFDKVLRMRRLWARAEEFEESFWSGGSLDDLYDRIDRQPADPMSSLFVSAMREWRRTAARGDLTASPLRDSLQRRIERVMHITLGREMESLERHMIFLASVGSAAPFVGLFGTVWGIKNAFEQIAIQQNTNLAVVAPGIAEALVATALGLLAAIPAVIFYNKLSTDADRIIGGYDSFADEFATILSRQLDS